MIVGLIQLTRGKFAIVDADDHDRLIQNRWYYQTHKPGYEGYAARGENIEGRRTTQLMHRLIMNAPAGVEVDHRNGNPLDNRKDNLRLTNHRGNMCNRQIQRNNSSGFKGVHFNQRTQRWRAQIKDNGIQIQLGDFEDKIEAARAYNSAARRLYGEFAILNDIPDQMDERQIGLEAMHG